MMSVISPITNSKKKLLVVGFREIGLLMPYDDMTGLVSDLVINTGAPFRVPGNNLLGHTLDGLGNPMEEWFRL